MGTVLNTAIWGGAWGCATGAVVSNIVSCIGPEVVDSGSFVRTTAMTGALGFAGGGVLGMHESYSETTPKPVHRGYHNEL